MIIDDHFYEHLFDATQDLPQSSLHASVFNKELTVIKYKVNIKFRDFSMELYIVLTYMLLESLKRLSQLCKPFVINSLCSPSDEGLSRTMKY